MIKSERAAGLKADQRKPPRAFVSSERFLAVLLSSIPSGIFDRGPREIFFVGQGTLYGGAPAPPLVIIQGVVLCSYNIGREFFQVSL